MVTREIIAENISSLRRSAKLTQAELAEKMNYSDKAISKWERGDSIPDVLVLAELAELFSVTVDYFLHEHADGEKKPVFEENRRRVRLATVLTAFIAPFAVSVLLFFVLREVIGGAWLWKLFIVPLPVVSIVALVFSSIWYKKRATLLLSVSAVLWTSTLLAYVFLNSILDAWFLFVIAIPLEAIVMFWFLLLKKKSK